MGQTRPWIACGEREEAVGEDGRLASGDTRGAEPVSAWGRRLDAAEKSILPEHSEDGSPARGGSRHRMWGETSRESRGNVHLSPSPAPVSHQVNPVGDQPAREPARALQSHSHTGKSSGAAVTEDRRALAKQRQMTGDLSLEVTDDSRGISFSGMAGAEARLLKVKSVELDCFSRSLKKPRVSWDVHRM